MKKNKLITLLKIFSKEEMKDFEKFIASPYFNKGRNFKPFYKILKKYYPYFDSPELTEENIFKQLYPDKEYELKKSSITIRVFFSQMTSMAEQFLVHDLVVRDMPVILYHALSFQLYLKNQYEYALEIALKGKESLDMETNQPMTYFHRIELYSLIRSNYMHLEKQMDAGDYDRLIILYTLGGMFDHLGKMANSILAQKRRYNKDPMGINLIRNILDNFDPVLFSEECINDEFDSKSHILMMYYLSKSLFYNEDDESLNYAINFFYNNYQNYQRSIQFGFFSKIHIICVTRAQEQDFEKYGMLAHKLSEFAWERNIYSAEVDAYIRFIVFYAIFNFKIAFLESKELQEFVDKYIEKVHPDSRESLRLYCYAFIHFKKKEFSKSLEYISKLSIIDISTKDNIHKLKIACLYELDFNEEALSAVDSFEHYLKNNKNVYEDSKINGRKFSNAIRTILKIKSGAANDFEMELKNAVNENKNSLLGKWFKEKVRNLRIRN